MKSARMGMVLATLAVLSCLSPEWGWATRVFTSVITGTVTATPTRTDIEVDNKVYHFRPDSAADKEAHTVDVGDVVDLTLDSLAGNTSPMVLAVTSHSHEGT